MSEKRSEASRINGGKGKGPVSPEGKARSRMNARKRGLFAQELVIPELGESWEELNGIREKIRTSFTPANPAEELLCNDVTVNYWRRQRVQRCETNEIRRAIRGTDLLAAVDLNREVSILKEKFSRLVLERLRATPLVREPGNLRGLAEVNVDLDAVRWELRRRAPGLDFLIETLEAVAAEADTKGELSPTSEALLHACLGANDASGALCVNSLIKKRADGKRGQGAPSGGPSNQRPVEENQMDTEKADAARPLSAEEAKQMDCATLASLIRLRKLSLELERNILQPYQEAVATDVLAKSAAVLTSSQLSRAETTYDKRLYKALSTLNSIRFQQAQLELARESLRQLSERARIRGSLKRRLT